MSLIDKLGTLLRGGARESVEALVDAHALRILGQEVYDFEQSILAIKRELTQHVAERLQLEQEQRQLRHKITRREAQLAEALRQEQRETVDTLADWIAEQEQTYQQGQQLIDEWMSTERERSEQLRLATAELARYRRALRLQQAQQRSQARVGAPGGRMDSGAAGLQQACEALQQSLHRIHVRQQDYGYRERAVAIVDGLQGGPLSAVDRLTAARERDAAKATIIERLRQGDPLRPA